MNSSTLFLLHGESFYVYFILLVLFALNLLLLALLITVAVSNRVRGFTRRHPLILVPLAIFVVIIGYLDFLIFLPILS
jgi:hypothetical protein